MCQEPGHTWVLLAFLWPQTYKKGETKGVSLCEEHLQDFLDTLARYNLVEM